MKYLVIFVLCCVALAAAAPQLLTYPAGYVAPYAKTVFAAPGYYNGYYPGFYGSRYVAPGYFGHGFI